MLTLRAYPVVPALLVALALAVSALAFEEPDGYGKAKFGMTTAEFEAAYPNAKPPALPTPAPGAVPPRLLNYGLDNQELGPLKGCGVQVSFFDGVLFDIQFTCPDKDAASAYLHSRFGTPTSTNERTQNWEGPKIAVIYALKANAIRFQDRARVKDLQAAVLGALRMQAQATPAGTPAQ